MKLIDADIMVTIEVYDDEHEEYKQERTTIAEALDRWTEEGCPPELIAQGPMVMTLEEVRENKPFVLWVDGKRWRYWDKRPTNEQRRNTPWE